MTRHAHLISCLQKNDTPARARRASFLKKLILSCYYGELRIHGRAANARYSLSQYLLDDRRMLFDFSRLSDGTKKRFKDWLFSYYQPHLSHHFQKSYELTEHLGRVAEKSAGFWSRIRRIFSFSKRYHRLDFDLALTNPGYQIQGVDFTTNDNGAIVDILPISRFLATETPPAATEYLDTLGEQSAKRVILTDSMVNKMLAADDQDFNYLSVLARPHPHAVHVEKQVVRQKMMQDYQTMHYYRKRPSFFRSVLKWIGEYFRTRFTIPKRPPPPKYDEKYELKALGIQVRIDATTNKVRLLERKPEITTFVFCGGGGRIFGHAGAASVAIKEYGIKPVDFAGSSCGAIMAACLYVGYTPEESAEIFSQFKQNDLVNLETATRQGLSTSDLLADKIKYYLREKLLEYINGNPQYFEKDPALKIKEAIESNGIITFRMVKDLKSHLPPEVGCKIGKSILVTSSNRTRLESVYYSTDTTPDEDFPDCVRRSANLPVVFRPVIDEEGEEHIDGGVLNNLPLNCFRDKSKSFIEHELSADTSVLAFQFDADGNEKDVIHSERKIFQEGALSNFFYGLTTGISNPKQGWVAERVERRKYASQVILIDAKGISATNLDLPDEHREKIKRNGEESARQYFDARRSKYSLAELNVMLEREEESLPQGLTHDLIRMMLPVRENQQERGHQFESVPQEQEDMIKDFENIEELLCYCAYRERWDIFDELCKHIESDDGYTEDEQLYAVINKLKAERDGIDFGRVDALTRDSSLEATNITRRANPYFNDAERYNQVWHTILYPLLHTDWQWIGGEQSTPVIRQDLSLLATQYQSLSTNNAWIVARSLAANLSSSDNSDTHLYLYLLKGLLDYSRTKAVDDEALKDAFINLMLLVDGKADQLLFDSSLLYGRWSFSEQECLQIITGLHNEACLPDALEQSIRQRRQNVSPFSPNQNVHQEEGALPPSAEQLANSVSL